MISKINSISTNVNTKKMQNVTVAKAKQANTQTNNTNPLASSKYASAFQAIHGIKPAQSVSFGGFTDFERSIVGDKEIRIPNLLDIPENIDLPLKEMPEKSRKLNAAGLNVVKTEEAGKDVYTISNDKGNVIFVGRIDKSKSKDELPTLVYKQGKYMPEITVKDPSLNGKSVKMLAGSHLKGDGFDLRMLGDYEPTPGEGSKNVSFKGRTVITTLNKEPRTLNAVESYMSSDLAEKTVKGDFYDVVKNDDPTIIIPAGGFGERFYNITREYENKPSGKLPTSNHYRIMATALNLAASAGIINADGTDSVKYLSQAKTIGGKNITHVKEYPTDGGAIAEGLKRDIIDNSKAAIIVNADVFTNADISRAYNALKTLPHAALVIPYYPVSSERAKSFGLLGVKKDEAGNLQISEFLEKPKYTSDAPLPNDFSELDDYDKAMKEYLKVQTAQNPNDKNSYLINPGFYFLSPQALKVLTAKGLLNDKETGLGKHVMPEIVRLANEGELLDAEGNQMKVYTVPLETKGGEPAVWDDIGTAEAYLKIIKDVAKEYKAKGNTTENKYYGVPEFVMSDFAKNTDLTTGIVYDSQKARDSFEEFKAKHNVEIAEGNIFVASPN